MDESVARDRAAALRALADLIEERPMLAGDPFTSVDLHLFPTSAAEMAALVRELGGNRQKDHGDQFLMVVREFGAGVRIRIAGEREQVCEAVVVGTETVEVPDPDAPKVTVERDVVEWRCAPVLGEAVAS